MNDHVIHFRHKNAEPLIVGDKVYKSAYDWELTEKDLKKAARELGETEEKKEACLLKLKEKLSNIRHKENMNDHVIHFRHKNAEPLIVGDKVYKSAYDWELTEKDLKKAARELGETEEKKEACLLKLKEKLSNIRHKENMNDHVIHFRHKNAEPLIVGDKVYKSAYDWELTEKDLKKAARELGETEEKKEACLLKLKEKLSKDSDVKYREDDFYLLRFLRVRKYDVKKAHHNVKFFYKERRKHSVYFVLPQELKSAQELNFLTVLPYTNEEGMTIFWLNLNKWNPSEKTLEEIAQISSTVCDLFSMNPRCQINGGIGIWDLNGLSMRHVTEVLWNGRLLDIVSILQKGYPWRIKKLIVLNTNRLVRLLYNMVRPVLQKKIADRIFLLGSDVEELHQHVSPALLPESLKGTLKEETCDTSQHVLDNLPYLKYERSFVFQ